MRVHDIQSACTIFNLLLLYIIVQLCSLHALDASGESCWLLLLVNDNASDVSAIFFVRFVVFVAAHVEIRKQRENTCRTQIKRV